MGIFVTANGFVKKTFDELKTEYEEGFKSIFGEEVDLDSVGPVGQLIAMLANRDADLWDGAEEIYNSRDPDIAEGMSLDKICAETGVIRQAATFTQIYNVYLKGTDGTIVTAGKTVRQSTGDYTTVEFSLDEAVTITKSACRYIKLTVGTPSDSEVFTITIDSIPYSDTATVPSDTAEDIAENLKVLIEAGTFGGTVTRTGAELEIEQYNLDFVISFTSNITEEELASGGDFTATTSGAIPVPATTLDTIVTPVSGWDEVTNPAAGVTGRNTETDSELRIRRAQTLLTGNATEDAIVQAISNNVTGVTAVSIESNRTDAAVGLLPPHSFHVVVAGGNDDDIAQQIWNVQPAGIASYGSTHIVVVDSEGQNQDIYFSRPTPIYIHVKVLRSYYSEEGYPTDGDAQVKDNIVDWALLNQPIGKDVIRQRLNIPVYEVPGIEDLQITIDGTANPGDTPTYAVQNIDIAADEYADFSTDRIIVGDIP
jgi:uncharacterized phage protein gp47/JayE